MARRKQAIVTSAQVRWMPEGSVVRVRGRVVMVHTPPTKSGKRVMFVTMEDEAGLLDVTVFQDVGRRAARVILREHELVVVGEVNRFGLRGVSILARDVAGAGGGPAARDEPGQRPLFPGA